MNIKVDNLSFNILTQRNKIDPNKTAIVFLHGFTGSAEDWKYLINNIDNSYLPMAIDLIGHGKTSHPKEIKYYSTSQIVKQLHNIFNALNLKEIILVGYSMGGRAALSYTIKYPKKIFKLVLESTTAGIENQIDRKARVNSDKQLADMITKQGIDRFVEYWTSLPLFKTQKKLYKNEYINLIEKRKSNSVIGLSNSLKGFGTGKMPDYWNKLSEIKQDVLLITGEKDKKFTEINKKMIKILPNSKHIIIQNAGHNIHLEKPTIFLRMLEKFLDS